MSFFASFRRLPHFEDSREVPAAFFDGVIAEMRPWFKAMKGQSELVFVKESRSLLLASRVLTLIDHGYCAVPIANEVTAEQLALMAEASGAQVIDNGKLIAARGCVTQQIPKGAAYGCLSSGTTGDPKLLFFTAAGALANAQAHAQSLGLQPQLRLVQALPLSHAFGLTCYLWTSLAMGLGINFLTGLLTPLSWAKHVGPRDVVHLSPALARLLLKGAAPSLSASPKILSVGGGLFDQAEFKKLAAQFPASLVYVTYGFTEAGPRVSTGRYDASRTQGWVGRPLPGVEVGVFVDGEVRRRGRGLLCVRSPSLTLQNSDVEIRDGYLVSRDDVVLDENGIGFIERVDDLIKVGGISVYPGDIVAACKAHPGVSDALVVKQSHPTYGEVPVLFIESDEIPEGLEQLLSTRLSPAQRPRRTIHLNRFPRSAFGKTNRTALRSLLS